MADELNTEQASRETAHIIEQAQRTTMRLLLMGSHFVARHLHRPRFESSDDAYRAEETDRVVLNSREDFTDRDRLHAIAVQKTGYEDVLKDVPHYTIGDVAIIPRYDIDETTGYIPTKDTAADYRMTPQEILEESIRNVKADDYKVDKIGSVLEALGVDADPEAPLYVCHNDTDYLGAAGMFVSRDVRRKVYDEIGGDFYVLPSSIHETLAIPCSCDVVPWELERLVQSVNAECVMPEDRLSDTIFKVDKTLKIVPAMSQKMEKNPLEELTKSIKL